MVSGLVCLRVCGTPASNEGVVEACCVDSLPTLTTTSPPSSWTHSRVLRKRPPPVDIHIVQCAREWGVVIQCACTTPTARCGRCALHAPSVSLYTTPCKSASTSGCRRAGWASWLPMYTRSDAVPSCVETNKECITYDTTHEIKAHYENDCTALCPRIGTYLSLAGDNRCHHLNHRTRSGIPPNTPTSSSKHAARCSWCVLVLLLMPATACWPCVVQNTCVSREHFLHKHKTSGVFGNGCQQFLTAPKQKRWTPCYCITADPPAHSPTVAVHAQTPVAVESYWPPKTASPDPRSCARDPPWRALAAAGGHTPLGRRRAKTRLWSE